MSFRNNQDALYAQIEALRQEAEQRDEQHSAQQQELQQQIATLERQLAAERRRTTRPSRMRWVGILGALASVTALIWHCQQRADRRRKMATVVINSKSTTTKRRRPPRRRPASPLYTNLPSLPLQRAIYWSERNYVPARRAALLATLSGMMRRQGEAKISAELLRRAEQSLEQSLQRRGHSKIKLRRRAVAQEALACALDARGQQAQARKHRAQMTRSLKQAFTLRAQAKAHQAMAPHCALVGRGETAAEHLRRAAELVLATKGSPLSHMRQVLDVAHDFDVPALPELALALERLAKRPKYDRAAARALLAELLWQLGRKDQARDQLAIARRDPLVVTSMRAQVVRAVALILPAEARAELDTVTEKVRAARYTSESGLAALAVGYARLGHQQKALLLSRREPVLRELVRSQLAAGRKQDAVRLARQAHKDMQLMLLLARAELREAALGLAERMPRTGVRSLALARLHQVLRQQADK